MQVQVLSSAPKSFSRFLLAIFRYFLYSDYKMSDNGEGPRISRRDFLKGLGGAGVAAGIGALVGWGPSSRPDSAASITGPVEGTKSTDTPTPNAQPSPQSVVSESSTAPRNAKDFKTTVDVEPPPPKDGKERNQLGALKIPETIEGIPLKLNVKVLDMEGKPVVDPKTGDLWTVETTFPGVRQYVPKEKGGKGLSQYNWKEEPNYNSTMVLGDNKEPYKMEEVVRAHSGRSGGKDLPGEPLKGLATEMYDPATGKDRERTDEEKTKFRRDHRFEIDMEWPEPETGQMKKQTCEASLHSLDKEQTERFWDQFNRHSTEEGPLKPPEPRIADFLPAEERGDGVGQVPTEYHPWNKHGFIYFCGERISSDVKGVDHGMLFFHVKVKDEASTTPKDVNASKPSGT